MSLTGKMVKGQARGYYRISSMGEFSTEIITEERKMELLILVRENNAEAKNELILAHIRLAVSIADRYITNYNCRFLDDELYDAAIEGVVVAINRIAKRGLKHDNVTGYIVAIVHSHVSECLRKSSLVPVPRGHIYHRGIQIEEGSFYRSPHPVLEVMDIIDCTIKNETERRIVNLRIAGHTDREIGGILNVPVTTVFRIRQTLKTRYERLNQDD